MIYGEGDTRDYRDLLDTDDILILVIVMSRYVVQIIRLICVLRKAKKNRDMH